MDRDYDICEKFPDTCSRFLIRVHGTRHVPKVLEEWAKQTTNECFAMNIRTGEIIAKVNVAERRTNLIRRKAIDELLSSFAAAGEVNVTDYEREMIFGRSDPKAFGVDSAQFLELCRQVARVRTIGL